MLLSITTNAKTLEKPRVPAKNVGDTGFDSPLNSAEKAGFDYSDSAHSSARDRVDDSSLARLIEIWPTLDPGVKAKLLTMAELRPDEVDDLNDVAASLVHHEGTPN